jgi:GABA(A) receptor-associated protein
MEHIMKTAEYIMNSNLLGGGVHIKSRTEADRIMNKYPDRIPVMVTRNKLSHNTPEIDKHKYLVPSDLSMGQLMFVIRKKLNFKPEKALFLFVDGAVVCNSEMVGIVYYRSHDAEDGFLHVVYSCENVFGTTF